MCRKELAGFLLDNPMSVHELATATWQKVRAVAEDLEHLRRSLRHGPDTFEIEPAECNQCGFAWRASLRQDLGMEPLAPDRLTCEAGFNGDEGRVRIAAPDGATASILVTRGDGGAWKINEK